MMMNSLSLANFCQESFTETDSEWAHHNYQETIVKLVSAFDARKTLEIGGGRRPLFELADIKAMNLEYTTNDIAQSELDLAPSHLEKVCFDIGGAEPVSGNYDIMFSRMVLEHVSNVGQAYRNIFNLLGDGGICINFHPTLFAFPFVVNKVIPDSLSTMMVNVLQDNRKTGEIPKFPAKYDWCHATAKQQEKLKQIGFSEVEIIPFWGHSYFRKIPPFQLFVDQYSKALASINSRRLAAFAFTIVRK